MPVVTEQHSLVETINDINNTIIPILGTTIENSKIPISNNKFTTNFPQPNIPIEPLYPAELKSKTSSSSKQQLNGNGGGGLNGQHSGNSSPLEIVGQTTGQLTKTQSSFVSYSSINSFQVINQDNLLYKPNAIVKPVRRNDFGLNDSHPFNGKSQRPKTNSAVNVLANVQAAAAAASGDDKSKQMIKNYQNNLNGDDGVIQINGNNLNISMKNKKNLKFDKVNGSIDYQSVDGGGVSNTSAIVAPHKKTGFFSEMANFAKELNQKLNRLKSDKSPTRSSSKNSTYPQINNSNDIHNKRPLFITTVPSGVFLPPAKEISPTAQKRVYAFSSRPRIFTIYRTNNNNYPTAAGYYTSEQKPIDNGNETGNKNEYDNDNKNENQTLNSNNNNNTNEKAKSSLNERIKRDVFRGSDDIRPYNYYRNMAGQLSSSSNGSTKQLNDKKDSKREPAPPQPFKNVMHDKRVIRGSNFSQIHCQDQQVYTKEQEAKRRLMLRKRCLARNQRNIIGSPPPIHGRVHIPIQTEKYLEELFDRPPEFDANTQTDLFLQRPPSPPYVPAKIGVDRYTQIEEGELFDFDSEAQPILDTLIGHSVQQSLIETLHEQEMAELKAKQEEFLARREAELAELRRLEEEERRLQEEKERRIKQDEIAREKDAKLQEEVTAAKLLQGHIATILPDVLSKLEPQSDFAHKFEVEKKICPWLSKEVAEEVGKIIDSREILTEIIKEIIIQRATVYADFVESETEDEYKCYEEEECSPEDYDGDEEFIREEVDRMIGGVDNTGGDDVEKRKYAGQENDKLETILEENCLPHETKYRVPIIEDTIVKSVSSETSRTSTELKSKQDTYVGKDELDNQESEQDRDAATYDIDSETIARSEFERILSLADSVDESEDVVTQIENVKQQKTATESTVSASATDDEDDDDDNEDDEKYLREQIEKMISDAEQSSTHDDSDNNNDISYIS